MYLPNHSIWNGKFYLWGFFIVNSLPLLVFIGLFLTSFVANFHCLLLYYFNFYHRQMLWSELNSNSSSLFWCIYLWSLYHIIGHVLSSTTLITWCKIFDLPPLISNIPRHGVFNLLSTTIKMVSRLTCQFSWYRYLFLYVLFFIVLPS